MRSPGEKVSDELNDEISLASVRLTRRVGIFGRQDFHGAIRICEERIYHRAVRLLEFLEAEVEVIRGFVHEVGCSKQHCGSLRAYRPWNKAPASCRICLS